jgi:hypothetical protein
VEGATVKRFRLVSSLWIPFVLAAMPSAAQTARPASKAPAARAAGAEREGSRLQMTIMEDAFQRAVEAAHGRALDALQENAGMPAMFSLDGNARARAFRIEGYGVFFDVDLPPIPRSVEWSFRVLDTGAVLVPDIDQLQQQLARLNDPRVTRVFDPIIRSMRTKVSGSPTAVAARAGDGEPPLVQGRSAVSTDPFGAYVGELKNTLVQIILEYGPTIQMGADDWLHVAAREVSPKLLPGNPTDATITLRIKAADLAALKAGRVTPEEAARRIQVKEVF